MENGELRVRHAGQKPTSIPNALDATREIAELSSNEMVMQRITAINPKDGHAKREGYNYATQEWLLARNSVFTILVAQIAQLVNPSPWLRTLERR